MTTLDLVLLLTGAATLAIGWRNVTCWALAFAWVVVFAWSAIEAPQPLGPGDLFLVDIITIFLIACKTVARHPGCEFEQGWDQFWCFISAPTFADRLILGLFVLVVWPAYVFGLGWFALWGAAMAQFLIAGGEACHQFHIRRRGQGVVHVPDPPGPLKIAWASVEPWHT